MKRLFFQIVWVSILFLLCQCNKVKTFHIVVLDENNMATTVRIRATDSDLTYYPPKGHSANFNVNSVDVPTAEESDIILDNDTRFAYVDGGFQIDLPKKEINLSVVKGFEYLILDSLIDFGKIDDTLFLNLRKGPLSNKGWYSGDVHVHYINPESALLEMKGENINVCNILISDFTADQDQFKGVPESISDEYHIVYYNQEYREANLGHVNFLQLKDHLITPVKPQREHQYPLNIQASDEVHEQGGHISWAHFAAWPGLEAPLGLVLGKVDAVELLCTMDPFEPPIFASGVIPDLNSNSGLKIWYKLLNCGLRIPLSAGTDKMNNQVTVGANRVYAKIEGEFNYEKWIESINKGQTFISNSPLIEFTIDDYQIGDDVKLETGRRVHIKSQVWSQLPVNRLEIVANGEVIAQSNVKIDDNNTYTARLDLEWEMKESTWITVRAFQFTQGYKREGVSFLQRRDSGGGPTLFNKYYGTLRPEVTFSHTSPIYFTIDNKPIIKSDDARYFVKYLENAMHWLDHEGSFPNELAKKEVLGIFLAGKEKFTEISKQGDQGK